MEFVKFRLVKVVNPSTGEEVEKLRVVSTDGVEYNLLTDKSIDDIKADRATLLSRVTVATGEFGDYARFRNGEVLEEF